MAAMAASMRREGGRDRTAGKVGGAMGSYHAIICGLNAVERDDEAGNPKFGDGNPDSAPNLYTFMSRLDAAIEAARASQQMGQFKSWSQPASLGQ